MSTKKNSGKKKLLLILAMMLVAAVAVLSVTLINRSNEPEPNVPGTEEDVDPTSIEKDDPNPGQTPEPIDFKEYTAKEMLDDLRADPDKAAEKYTDVSVKVSGVVCDKDIEAGYIVIGASSNAEDISITCVLEDGDAYEFGKSTALGDKVVVYGSITNADADYGYQMYAGELEKQ